MSSRHTVRLAVTRLEVMMSIAAIAVLAALVMPAIGRELLANRVVLCTSNLAHLGQGAIEYATWNDDWIVGAPSGSGAYLQTSSAAYGQSVQIWDFLGPLDHMWNPGTPLPARGDMAGVIDRFNMLRSKTEYLCPENRFSAAAYVSGPNAGFGPMVSYNTCRYQLWRDDEYPSAHDVRLPYGWRPSITAIGSPANKVFCADGSRYSTTANPPDYNLSVREGFGGAFADTGAFEVFSRSWDRGLAPGNGNPNGGDVDARQYAYRHGESTINRRTGQVLETFYKLNLVFYDGHVETQDDLTSSNPEQWLPSGSTLYTSGCWQDTISYFGLPPTMIIGD